MNRESLENLVIEATGRSDKLVLIRNALNLAVSEVSSQRMWSDLITRDTVTINGGDQSVELADGVARVLEITVVRGILSRQLIIKTKEWMVQTYPTPDQYPTGIPVYGFLEGKTLYFMPRPNGTYPIRYTYYQNHPTLDYPTSEVLIKGADSAVAAYATHWVFQSMEKLKEAEVWHGTYLRQLETAKKLDRDNPVNRFQSRPRVSAGRDLPGVYNWEDPFTKTQP